MFNRFKSPLLAVALSVAALPLPAAPLGLDVISAYLDQMSTAYGRFRQYNADGSTIEGDLQIKRPGRIRFAYDSPSDALILAIGGQLAIFDPRSNTGPDRYPLAQTPLNIILRQDVDLDGETLISNVREIDGYTIVAAQDAENPQLGMLELYFSNDPVALRQWVITDEFGNQTATALSDLRLGLPINDTVFSIQREMRERGFTD